MEDLTEKKVWNDDVYINQSSDALKKTHQLLAKRTEYLKENLDILAPKVSKIKTWDQESKVAGPGNSIIAIGTNAAGKLSPDIEEICADNIALGRDALGAATQSNMNIAIGAQTISKNTPGAANIAIGSWSLTHVEADTSKASSTIGSRNIAIGTLSLHFLEKGNRNVFIGRDAGHALVNQSENTGIGYATLSHGQCTMYVDGTIKNQKIPVLGNSNSALGSRAGSQNANNHNVFIGNNAGKNSKNLYASVFIGSGAAENAQKNTSLANFIVNDSGANGTYVQSGKDITINIPNHKVKVGNHVTLNFKSGEIHLKTKEDVWMEVKSANDDSFTVESPINLSASGDVILVDYETDNVDDAANSGFITVVGRGAVRSAQKIYKDNTIIGGYASNLAVAVNEGNTIIGGHSAQRATDIGMRNVIIGTNVCAKSDSIGSQNVIIGGNAGEKSIGNSNSFLGYLAGGALTNGDSNTLIGRDAGYRMTSGILMESAKNVTCIGASSCASGSNQIQLGNSLCTTFTYGAVQSRADERDKIDIKDTTLGLNFINKLRPVDFKWNYRDDYLMNALDIDESGQTRQNFIQLKNDGSKKRNRFHHGLIAQDIEKIIKETGIDFGGFQDHSIDGGEDIKSIGYAEFIGPLIKAIQELSKEVEILKRTITNKIKL